jgi:diguanylate cyclase (GGDEF)-like protein/PAS domain S-box-containing protein
VAWNSRNYTDNNFFTFIGIGYLYVGVLELLHTLAFDGMPFTQFSANMQTQVWIAARYLQSISILAATAFINRGLKVRLTLTGYTVITALALLTIIVWPIFPTTYIPDRGLTPFKITSEFVVCAVLLIAGGVLWLRRSSFDRVVLSYILLSIGFGIAAEASFMLYADTTNMFYMLGHLCYIVSFFLIFRAITVTGLLKPYDILFRNLARSRDLLQKERNKLQNLLDIEESIFVAVDSEHRVTSINRKGREVLGLGEQEILGKPLFETFMPRRIHAKAVQGFVDLMNGRAELIKYIKRPVLTANGEERTIAWHNELLRDESGKIIGTVSSGQDITERRQAEQLFQAIFDRSPIGMYVAQDHKFKMVNPQFVAYVEYPARELMGTDTLSLVVPEDRATVRQEAIRALKSSRDQLFTYDYKAKTKSGKLVCFMESITSIIYDGRRATLGTIVDISERKQSEELFKSLSLIDDLTGLYNRRGFLTLATKQLKLSFRMSKGVTLLFADLNRLKWINDNLGHLEGDSALINTARILKETFRESDIIGRIGGDEFAVFMAGADESYSGNVVSRLESKIKEFNVIFKKPYEISLSFGIARSEADTACNLNDLLETADRFMYENKRDNRPTLPGFP